MSPRSRPLAAAYRRELLLGWPGSPGAVATSETRSPPAERREPVVDQQQREVGAGVAEGGHLPVDDGAGSGRRRRSAGCRAGSRRARSRPPPGRRPGTPLGQPAVQLVGVRALAGLGALELLAPAAHLPLQEALRAGRTPPSPTAAGSTACSAASTSTSRPAIAAVRSGPSALELGRPCGTASRRPAPSRRTARRARRGRRSGRTSRGTGTPVSRQRASSRCTRGPCRGRWPARGPSGGRRTIHHDVPSVTS